MSRETSHDELSKHKGKIIGKIDSFLSSLINSHQNDKSKSDQICYWLNEYIEFLEFETKFKPEKLIKYERGNIIKVKFGFNIGNEFGGLHYAIVVENDNSIRNGVVTVIPLTSQKDHVDVNNLQRGKIFLGNELFVNLNSKLITLISLLEEQLKDIHQTIDLVESGDIEKDKLLILKERMAIIDKKLDNANRINKEVQKMKKGSIALVSQITTVSKIRIADPRNTAGVLHGIKLSNEKLNEIDACIRDLFTKNAN